MILIFSLTNIINEKDKYWHIRKSKIVKLLPVDNDMYYYTPFIQTSSTGAVTGIYSYVAHHHHQPR